MTPQDEGRSGGPPPPTTRSAGDGRPAKGPGTGDLGAIAFQLAATIFIFGFAGQWLDRRFHTGSWLTICLVFVGAGAAFYNMYRKLMAAQKRSRDERAQRPR